MSASPKVEPAEVVEEYGPFPDLDYIRGVSFDGDRVWCAGGEKLVAVDTNGERDQRRIDVHADAGTAFDGRFVYQLAAERILKIDPDSGEVVHTIPAPDGNGAGMAWAEGSLWVGQYGQGKILRVDPETGEIQSTVESSRFVTGVTWMDGALWHGAKADEAQYELRRIDPATGDVEARLEMAPGVVVTGMTANAEGDLLCAGGADGRVRRVRTRSD